VLSTLFAHIRSSFKGLIQSLTHCPNFGDHRPTYYCPNTKILSIGYIGPPVSSMLGGSLRMMIQVFNRLSEDTKVTILANWKSCAEVDYLLNERVALFICPPELMNFLKGPLRLLKRRFRHIWMMIKSTNELALNCLIVDQRKLIYDACLLRALGIMNQALIVRWGNLASEKLSGSPLEKRKAALLLTYADMVVTNSRMTARELINLLKIPSNKIRVIENCLDFNYITLNARGGMIENDDKVMICVEYLHNYKNTIQILRALRLILSSEKGKQLLKGWKLWIIGDGEQKSNLIKYSHDYHLQNMTVFWGYQENPWKFMQRAEFFVTASRGDGFMLALIEAVHLGLPVIYPNYGVGAADYLQELGIGRMFSNSNDESLASAILEEITNPNRPSIKQCQMMRNMFSVEKCSEAYREAAKTVCDRNKFTCV